MKPEKAKAEKAKEIFAKEIKCREVALECNGECGSCEYSTGWQQLREAMLTAISALEFRENYDNFWEEVKTAGKKGKETEIHHSGRVFRIREVAQ